MRSNRKISYMPDWGVFLGTVDVKVYPTVRIYLPNRKGPMVTVTAMTVFSGKRQEMVKRQYVPASSAKKTW